MGEEAVTLYPRKLRPKERDLLDAVLPENRRGYLVYRNMIAAMEVIGEGRRGEGNFVLGKAGDRPDLSTPMGPVAAYGVVETTRDVYFVSVREPVGDQMDVEIVSSHGETVPDHYEEKRRWSYSAWIPGAPSPDSGESAREVPVGEGVVLAILAGERRVLVHDPATGMNHLIPVTTLYNELMIVKKIRDPRVALQPGLLFENAASFTDADLRQAFLAYNRIRRIVSVKESAAVPAPGGSIRLLLKKWFRKERP